MYGIKIFIVFLFLNGLSLCQFDPGAKQIAMSYSNTAYDNDVFALFNNPSCLTNISSCQIGIYYSPSPFGLSELSNAYAAFDEPTNLGSFAVGAMDYGFELYREYKIVLGYAKNILNNFSAGAAINYHAVNIKNYGSTSAIYLDAGFLIQIADEISYGFLIKNINRANFGKNDNHIPTLLRTGVSYIPVKEFLLNFSVEKETLFQPSFLFGVNYDIVEFLSLRTGFSSEPAKFSGGLGINYSFLSLDYAFFSHQDLGITHQAGLIIHL